MNIFNKVALQGLKKNRAQTLVTVIGVALSAALITAIATFAISLQAYMVNGAIAKYGDWHVDFPAVDSSFVQKQAGDSRVAKVTSFENIGYAALQGGKNPDKPYLAIAGFNRKAFDTLPINMIAGRLPENDHEILIPAHISSNGGVELSVGDTLTLGVGVRSLGGKILNQHDLYGAGEKLIPSVEKTYTVVGICQRPAFEERSAPGYTAITTSDKADAAGSLNAFITLKRPSQAHAYTKSVGKGTPFVLNDNVLRFLGSSDDTLFQTLLYSVGTILIVLVMLGSVFLIYNSFNISLNERTHQFGILMSVGATEKQLRNLVLFEGLCIGIIGIPPGILIGIPSIYLVLSFVAKNFTNILYSNVALTLKISAPALLAAAVISMVTTLISAYIPAKKAAGMPVMECIRQTRQVRIEAKDVKISRFKEHIYGLEGTLALKNFKRNKRRYRSIILSLTLSMVLFVSASAFVSDLKQTADQANVVTNYDIGVGIQRLDDSKMLVLYDKLKTVEGITESSYQAVNDYSCTVQTDDLSEKYREAAKDDLTNETVSLPIEIQFLDDGTYLQIIHDLGLPANEYTGKNAALIAVAKMKDNPRQAKTVSQLYDMFKSPSLNVTVIPKVNGRPEVKQSQNASITCVQLVPPDTPPYTGAYPKQPYFFQIMAPWSLKEKLSPSKLHTDLKVKGFTFRSDNPSQSAAQMQSLLDLSDISGSFTLYNLHGLLEQNRNILFIVKLFTAVFTGMISLIAVANVFNTISTNIKQRRRELSMLRSVGMSDRSFNKMMRFECLLYGLRTLLVGLPVSVIFSLLIDAGMVAGGAALDFTIPWSSIAISILGVFFVILLTMLYATSKIRKENIIDALRDDMA